MSDQAGQDRLKASELVPAEGGQWRGLLFDNPKLGLPPELSWSFTFGYADVRRDYGDSPVSVDIDWMSLPTPSWRRMAGQAAHTARFAETAEASVYFFEHHRYQAVDLRILDQREATIHVSVNLTGDLDGLGIESVTASGWLTFAGIAVQLSGLTSAEAAAAALGGFTDVTGLSPSAGITDNTFVFRPASWP